MAGEGYVLSGGFGASAAPAATLATAAGGGEYVNEGLKRWAAGREAWLSGSKDKSYQGAAPLTRPRPK